MTRRGGSDPLRRIVAVASDASIGLAGLLAIAIAVADLLGAVDNVPWLQGRIGSLTLVVGGLLLLSRFVDERIKLDQVLTELGDLRQETAGHQGYSYIDRPDAVERTLGRAAQTTNESLVAIGGRSQAEGYLLEILNAVKDRSVEHIRLLDGSRVSHVMHTHCQELLDEGSSSISWTPHEKFLNMTVVDDGVFIALPGPRKTTFSLLAFSSASAIRRYYAYVYSASESGLAIRNGDSLKILCEECGNKELQLDRGALQAAMHQVERRPKQL